MEVVLGLERGRRWPGGCSHRISDDWGDSIGAQVPSGEAQPIPASTRHHNRLSGDRGLQQA